MPQFTIRDGDEAKLQMLIEIMTTAHLTKELVAAMLAKESNTTIKEINEKMEVREAEIKAQIINRLYEDYGKIDIDDIV